jgi:hypothetical protein
MPALSRLSARPACSWNAGHRRQRSCRRQGSSVTATIQLTVEVVGQVFGNLQDAPLDLGLFETGHAIEREDRKRQQRQRQGQRKQDEKRPYPLGWQAVNEEAGGHVTWLGP